MRLPGEHFGIGKEVGVHMPHLNDEGGKVMVHVYRHDFEVPGGW